MTDVKRGGWVPCPLISSIQPHSSLILSLILFGLPDQPEPVELVPWILTISDRRSSIIDHLITDHLLTDHQTSLTTSTHLHQHARATDKPDCTARTQI